MMGKPQAMEALARARLDALAKPRGSLGRLEDIAVALARSQDSLTPRTRPRRLVLFAADHGVVASGVSAWPSDVTGLMIATILRGGAASSVLARETGTELRLIDVGSLAQPPANPPGFYRDARVRAGSRNLANEAALTPAEFEAAWAVGKQEAERAAREGCMLVAAGEMGIGNTTSAACLTAMLAGVPIDIAVGPGAGADETIVAVKRAVVARALTREATDSASAIPALAGLEIAAMAGFYATAASGGLTIILDGYVATAAALVAEQLAPGTARAMIAAHRSAEPGHERALAKLGLQPLLEMGMRLGEGTGALAAMPLIDQAGAILREMMLLEEIGVARRD
jgi:nicotinate-nucleotide--dimethylbenzimidazole phosphoribosyltransferase